MRGALLTFGGTSELGQRRAVPRQATREYLVRRVDCRSRKATASKTVVRKKARRAAQTTRAGRRRGLCVRDDSEWESGRCLGSGWGGLAARKAGRGSEDEAPTS